MKINKKAIAKAAVILTILTILPIVGRMWIPSELFRALSSQGGFDLVGLLNRIAIVGIALSVLVLLRGHVGKASSRHLAVSTVWKVFWLIFVFFLLGLGYPETLGLAILGGKTGSNENIVVFDFRLFTALATAIVVLMILRSVMQFKEARLGVADKVTPANKVVIK